MERAHDENASLISRRTLLRGAAGIGLAAAGATLIAACGNGGGGDGKASEPDSDTPLETTSITLWSLTNTQCIAAHYMAEPFLREAGFTDVQYPLYAPKDLQGGLTSGKLQMGVGYTPYVIPLIEAGEPLMMLGGVHVGC